jgi:hypothetical protein
MEKKRFKSFESPFRIGWIGSFYFFVNGKPARWWWWSTYITSTTWTIIVIIQWRRCFRIGEKVIEYWRKRGSEWYYSGCEMGTGTALILSSAEIFTSVDFD